MKKLLLIILGMGTLNLNANICVKPASPRVWEEIVILPIDQTMSTDDPQNTNYSASEPYLGSGHISWLLYNIKHNPTSIARYVDGCPEGSYDLLSKGAKPEIEKSVKFRCKGDKDKGYKNIKTKWLTCKNGLFTKPTGIRPAGTPAYIKSYEAIMDQPFNVGPRIMLLLNYKNNPWNIEPEIEGWVRYQYIWGAIDLLTNYLTKYPTELKKINELIKTNKEKWDSEKTVS